MKLDDHALEAIGEHATIVCSLDFNYAIGRNLQEKLQSVYVAIARMQHICGRTWGRKPEVLFVNPAVAAALDITEGLKWRVGGPKLCQPYLGKAWSRWYTYLIDVPAAEHHLYLTYTVGGTLPVTTGHWCRISLTNFIMANNFGYYNLK